MAGSRKRPTSRKTKPKVSRLERTAFHEAGHAVASFDLRRAIEGVTINPDDDFLGMVTHTPFGEGFRPDIDSGGRTRSIIERQVTIFLAGNAAECHRLGRNTSDGASSDFEKVVTFLNYLSGDGDEADAYAKWLWVRTRNFIRTPLARALTTALAEELLRRRKMNGRQVRTFLRETRIAIVMRNLPKVVVESPPSVA